MSNPDSEKDLYKTLQQRRQATLASLEEPLSDNKADPQRIIPKGGARGGAHQLALGLLPPPDPQHEFYEEHHAPLRAFQSPLANNHKDRDKLSNLFNLWESIPKYSAAALAGTPTRSVKEPLPLVKHEFEHDGDVCEMTLTPAQFEEKIDGETVSVFYYPSTNEELIELMLVKFAMERAEIFEAEEESHEGKRKRPSYGVAFSLSSLREFMSQHKKGRTYAEIKHALQVMNKTSLELKVNGQILASATLLPELFSYSQRGFKRNDPASEWAVRFHPMISNAINNGSYRQFNLRRLLRTRSKVALLLSKMILSNPRNISTTTPLRLSYLDFVARTGELQYSRRNDGISKLVKTANELKKHGMVNHVDVEYAKNRNGKLIDATLNIFASEELVAEIRASYKKMSLIEIEYQEQMSQLLKTKPKETRRRGA